MFKLKNYIGGVLTEPQAGKYLDNINPAIGEVYSLIPDSDAQDIEHAVQAAVKAFDQWSALPVKKRGEYMLKLAALIDRDKEKLAEAETTDNGKPLQLSRTVDIPRASENLRFYATAIEHFASESHLTDNVALNYTTRSPLGAVGCISPWNLPLYLFTWKIAPALAAGNTVVAKPSELTPMTAYLLSELCIEAGLPAGVLNIVHGLGAKAGEAIVSHPEIAAISFTGGTQTGATISRIAAPMFKKISLELGGKNPNIIFADADFDKALNTSVQAAFSNQGQICLCGSRIFVEKAIYEKFRDGFVEKVNKLKVGDPLQEDSRMGAVVSKAHQQKILSYIDLAKEEGGTVIAGGHAVQPEGRCKGGYFVAPTVIEGLTTECRTNQEEIFGPVVTITPFEDVSEVLAFANSTRYGLAASVWTNHIQKAHQVAHALKSGIVWVNCWMLRDLRTPFGGTKASGVGREGGLEALRFFTEPKNICIKL
jgi:aminomuconate-semialdehyde/2-hydroxymuconate-6-semialdehyde dehydrogenase